MIQLDLPAHASAAERWALDTLVDLSRLLPAEGALRGAVQVSIGDGEGHVVSAGKVVVGRRVLARVVAVAGAGTEQGSSARDQHDRVPAEANPLVIEGSDRRPAVQEMAGELLRAVRQAAGNGPVLRVAPWPEGRRWAVAMTHDIDVVAGWPLFTLLRMLELARKGRAGDVVRVLGAATAAAFGDPVTEALRAILAAEARHGLPATWFALVGDPTPERWRQGDVTYRIESRRARRLLDAIAGAGHEIGLHGSMRTGSSPDRFAEERSRLGRATGVAPQGIRQHFLKMHPGNTQRGMQAAGFSYDATYGFSGRNGFRLGVADTVVGWDVDTASTTSLEEVPLHWMDRALSKYQGIEDPNALVDDGLALAEVARATEGLWVGLWHPNLAPALGYPGAPEAFDRMLGELMSRGPWAARLGDIVAWRRARRATRVRALAPDGRAELVGKGVLE